MRLGQLSHEFQIKHARLSQDLYTGHQTDKIPSVFRTESTYCPTGGLAVVVRTAHCTFRATAQNSNFTLSEQQTKPTHGLRVGSWEDDFQKTFHDIKCCPVLVSGLYR